MNKPAAALIFLWLVVGAAQADDRIVFPEGNKAWTVNITYRENSQTNETPAAQRPQATRVDCASFDGTECYKISWSNGQISEVWSRDKITMVRDSVTGRIALSPNTLIPGLVGLLNASLFSWVTEANPAKETVFEKRKALLYEKPARTGTPDLYSNSEDWNLRQAWVDTESRLPVAYNNGLATFYFSFQNTPPAALQMPEDFAKLHARIQGSTSRSPSWTQKP
ncbi:hypothetical protein TSACC_3543 [Terrimicrobium sacchariphilum]|jgi:hypothetical protein|uniref:Uncharacterized protein n=1 Tax=Terrimicrobium sacchariphilum TaxID=690879 RepID=A0A146GFV9_TERSA|nr:hypothetical protein [Terrimicrobium sacchariphilum]GAT35477.1 hypothetical protein TSACC_3543 [Terrimicrobium sacchariphilum]